jgi:membrane carboxypeptidase/penicillin-binding protein
MWIGDDLRERPLGKNDAAFMSALPMWARFMAEATTGQPLREIPWEVPAGVKPYDRGGSKGRSLEGHMPLVPHKKEKVDEAPPGLKLGAPRERPTG